MRTNEEGTYMAICKNCGSELKENARFCEFCGTRVEEETTPAPYTETNQDTYQETYREPAPVNAYHSGIAPRSIAVAVILSIVTCGLYGIYWMIKINDEINELAGETSAASGVMVFVLTLITCGIYGLYWMFKMGERCDKIKGNSGSSGILFLILAIFGFSIISYCLMQDAVNKAVS